MHLPTLLIQIGVILIMARAIGWAARKINQPQVVGEMIAGILLGPSAFGWFSPGLSAVVFPPDSLGFLNALSQIGLLLFMFLVGLEFNPKLLHGQGKIVIITSHVSIIVPFLLGILLAAFLYPYISDKNVVFLHFALFFGVAMSVTAFPVLARILNERNMLQSRLGVITIACAAVDDITAWGILAGVILLVRSGDIAISLWLILGSSAAYIILMLTGVRKILGRLVPIYYTHNTITQSMLAFILLLVLISAWITEQLGIHALFGAFLIGVILPKHHEFVQLLTHKLEDVVVVLLLPIFFAFTGLRTSIGFINGINMWFYCGLIIAVAILGKLGGSTLAARMTGLSWREASALGMLMNTRGLMELVILNIGVDIGVISPTLFTMMVFMALITTFMTTPLLELIYPAHLLRQNGVSIDLGREKTVPPISPQ